MKKTHRKARTSQKVNQVYRDMFNAQEPISSFTYRKLASKNLIIIQDAPKRGKVSNNGPKETDCFYPIKRK